jgi:hypothetical protein
MQIGPMIQDLEDLGVNLHIAQLLRERAIGTTWPWVQPHLGHPLSERLNSVTEKCLQEVHSHQTYCLNYWMTSCKVCIFQRSFVTTMYT